MNIAALVVGFSVAATVCARSDLGETWQEVQARYTPEGVAKQKDRSEYSIHNPVQFQHKHRLILVWFQDGHSVAEMFLFPHGLCEEHVGKLLTREAGPSKWVRVPCKEKHAVVWARNDRQAVAWTTGCDSECGVFVAVETEHLRHLAHSQSFQAVAANTPLLWSDVLKFDRPKSPADKHSKHQ